MSKITVKADYENKNTNPQVTIDENKLPFVKSVKFDVSTETIPTFTFETIGIPYIDMQGRCDFRFSVDTIQQACKVLTHTLQTNEEFYNAFVASIESGLRESTIVWEEWEYTEIAKKIADRIIGLERE